MISLIILTIAAVANGQFAAMSVDLGSQFLKVGLIKPGIPMQIVLNKESSRKTPSVVAIKDKELVFSEEATSQRRRSPSSSFAFLVDLLGKKIDNPMVTEYHRRFPFAQLVGSLNRGTVVFKNAPKQEGEGEEGYNPEQLLAMILSEARSTAVEFAGQNVVDAVISVPAFFNQAERRAMKTAAEIAGLNVLALINDNTAAGLNYGMFRRNEFTEKPSNVLIYDIGASKATASIFQYVVIHDAKTKESSPQLTSIGVGFDRFLGGLEFSMRLRELLADKFSSVHKTDVPVRDDHRAMTKLFYEAERVKTILSTITDTTAQVETLHEGVDFRAPVTRTEFEAACADLYKRIRAPVDQALKMAEITMEEIDHVILMGAASRMPKFQETLQTIFNGKELGRYLNADEAIAMGAIYYAAHKVKGFKVKKFLIKEANLYPIEVHFASEKSERDADVTTLRRMLYGLKNNFPQKKMITFTKHSRDFEIFLNYGEISWLNEAQAAAFGSLNITRIDLLKIEQALQNHTEEGTVFKGIRAHFNMDDSGIVEMIEAESVFHKPPPPPAEPSTLSKIGQSISNFFGSSDGTNDTAEIPPSHNETDSAAENNTDTGENVEQKIVKNETTVGEKAKPLIVKVQLAIERVAMDVPFVSAEWINHSMHRLEEFKKVKQTRQMKEKMMNDLESFVVELTVSLEDPNFSSLLTEEELNDIKSTANSMRIWADEQDINTPIEEFATRLQEGMIKTEKLHFRYMERKTRPKALKLLETSLNNTATLLENSEPLMKDNILTQVEVDKLKSMANETEVWLTERMRQQNATATNQDPVILVKDIMTRNEELERELKYLLNKIQIHQNLMEQEKRANETASSKGNETEANDDQQSPPLKDAPADDDHKEEEEEDNKPKEGNDSHVEL